MAVLCCGSIIFSMLSSFFSLISYPWENSLSLFLILYTCRSKVSLALTRKSEGTVTHSLKGVPYIGRYRCCSVPLLNSV